MANTIEIKNFKCFDALSIDLPPLVLLAGMNGAGKSSFLQAVLSLAQSGSEGLSINGEYVKLGTAQDVLYEGAETEQIQISINGSTYIFDYDRPEATLLRSSEDSANPELFSSSSQFTYLECERIGPRSSFETSADWVHTKRQVGSRGQYCAHFLAAYGDEHVPETRHHPASASESLRSQVEAWLGEISPGTRLDVVPYQEMDLVRLAVSFVSDRWASRGFRPTNVGFGITYVMPVIVAGLLAPADSWLIVENPEAHLHPRGQAQMGAFLSRVAADGVNVIIETHSDHVMNGIRLAVRRRVVEPTDVAMHYFEREGGRVTVESPKVRTDGRLSRWPVGFFDEWEISLSELLTSDGE